MYNREYDDNLHTFEASGGLIYGALVMQDRETDSYWAIMAGEAIVGKMTGTKLEVLPISQKVQWKDWQKKHPNTLVLSIDGEEDGRDPYKGYFISAEGYRGLFAKDGRLRTKDPIFAFILGDKKYAIPFKKIKNGNVFDLGEEKIFVYRHKKSKDRASTVAYKVIDSEIIFENGKWLDRNSGCKFNTKLQLFEGSHNNCPEPLVGIDTFWYMWSLTHPDTKVLE